MAVKKFRSLSEEDQDLDKLEDEQVEDFAFDGIQGTQTEEEHARKKAGVKAKKMGFSLPADLYDDLMDAAHFHGISVSKMIQIALKAYFSRPKEREGIKQYREAQAAAAKYMASKRV